MVQDEIAGAKPALWADGGGEVGVVGTDALDDAQRSELAALAAMVQRLKAAMRPVAPHPGFVRSLGRELVGVSASLAAGRDKRRRAALLAAAAVGSVLSVASVVGALVYLTSRRRIRPQAGAAPVSV